MIEGRLSPFDLSLYDFANDLRLRLTTSFAGSAVPNTVYVLSNTVSRRSNVLASNPRRTSIRRPPRNSTTRTASRPASLFGFCLGDRTTSTGSIDPLLDCCARCVYGATVRSPVERRPCVITWSRESAPQRLNAIVTGRALFEVLNHPHLVVGWKSAIFAQHPNWLGIAGVCLLLFPRLALGLSGFETGVSVMPLISGENLEARIRNTQKLLVTAAGIMSIFLIATSFVTTILIPSNAFADGGAANGRALAFLAHQYLGNIFGSVYDISTILILAFAGASAMAGLLNLIPRYLPRFGMAPEWARAVRPLVRVFMGVAFFVTISFHANVDAQGGAYATGVLILITSAAGAVTLSVWNTRARFPFLLVALIFVYTTLMNIWERPEGLKISCFFIFTILFVSFVSRATRSTELRISGVELPPDAADILRTVGDQPVRFVPRRPRPRTPEDFQRIDNLVRTKHGLPPNEKIVFLEVERTDASEFTEHLTVQGKRVSNHCILYARSPIVANSIAALLIHVESMTGRVPHIYFKWKEGNPVTNMFRFLFLGEGDAAPITHEVLRKAVPDIDHRPIVHVS